MSVQFLSSCLKLMEAREKNPEAFRDYFARVRSDLVADKKVAARLITLSSGEEQQEGHASALLCLLLDEARMGVENDAQHAAGFLAALETSIQAGVADNVLDQHHLLGFAKLYRRVGLPVPDILMITPDTHLTSGDVESSDISTAMEQLAKGIENEGGGPYDLFNGLDEMSAAMPDEMKAAFTNQLATFPHPFFERCALYFFICSSALVQEAVIAGLFERQQRAGLLSDTLTLLPAIRGWIEAGRLRDAIDELVKRERRKGGASDHREVPKIDILAAVASIADGVGAQSIAVLVKRGRGVFNVAMVLTKDGFGVKDAFVIPCKNRREADGILMQCYQEGGGASIGAPTLKVLLEGALADGIKQNCLPAPGFLEVMEACNLLDLRPQELSLDGLLEFVDSEGEIRNAPASSRKRWMNSRPALDSLTSLADSWFEDTEETRRIITAKRSARAIKGDILNYLEMRRDLWSRRFLQSAAMLRDGGALREWKALTVSAHGLMSGAPLADIPLMEMICDMTIVAARARMK